LLHRWGAVTLFHGMPSDRVRAVAQTPDGAMWFGTDAGLARYDGRRIQTVSETGLAGPRVRALRVDAGGALWVGADGGAYVRAAGAQAFRHVAETEGKSVMAVITPAPGRALLATADGLVFECRLAADTSLAVRQIGDPLTIASGKPQPVQPTSLALVGETIVVGTRGRGLLTMEPGGETKEIVGRPRAFYVESLERGADSALFLGTQTSGGDSGVFRVDGERLARPSKLFGGATGTVSALAVASGGDLYAATDGRGVFHYRDGKQIERFTFANTAGGLRSDRVYAAFIDREGVAWFGTDRGVCRYDPKGVSVEPLSAETENNFVRSIYRTRAGRLLVGTNRGLYARDARPSSASVSATPWRAVEEVAGKTVYAIAEDRAGTLLVGTGAGLFVGLQTDARAAAMRLKPEVKAKEQADSPAQVTGQGEGAASTPATDAQANAGTQGETTRGEAPQGDATNEEKKDEPPAKKAPEPALRGSVRAIAVFGGATYVATYGRGLERFDGFGRRALVWPKASDDARGREAVSLYADDANGRLWIGTANAGAFYFDGKETRADAALASLNTSAVWGMSSAGDWLWLATGRGLYALRRGGQLLDIARDLDARGVIAIAASNAAAGANSLPPQAWCATAGGGVLKVAIDDEFGPLVARLDAEQGLPSQSVFAVLPLEAEAEGGSPALLVGTTKGLARYEPGAEPPALTLTRVTTSRAHQPEELREKVLTLEYPQNGLVVDVSANASRTFPEQFQYAYLLQDDKGQVIRKKLSRDSQFQVESLRAGRYRVTARAYTIDLVPSAPLVFEFEVGRAPFPRTILLLSVLLALALVALLWGYVQHRKIVHSRAELLDANRQLGAARLQLANEAESERRRIARDLHDQTLADLRRLLLLTDEMQAADAAAATNGGNGAAAQSPAVDPSELRAEIESISHEVRRICEDLSPSALENVGFAAALEWSLASALAHLPVESKFVYDFVCDENLEERLSFAPGAQMQVYRIVQEAVSNICRHAQATRVRLSLHVTDEGDFVLRLEDDGRGFDHSHRKARKGRGLAGIRARASLIEAEVAWREREGGGTVLELRKSGAASRAVEGVADSANHV
jgi:signal transduction histidine kinase/ligand-binding sensor domain-containing protein